MFYAFVWLKSDIGFRKPITHSGSMSAVNSSPTRKVGEVTAYVQSPRLKGRRSRLCAVF